MRSPSIAELPPAPAGKIGWPWTEGSPRPPQTMPNDQPWPRVTVVTPSYNQAEFLEETIRSVLLQGYPDLEYVVIDGGSQDGSVEIIEKYAPWLAYWVSEPDNGQSHAINKGFRRATGEILAWLNSDDSYYPRALERGAEGMKRANRDIFVGAMDKVEVNGDSKRFVRRSSPNADNPFHPFPILANGRRHSFHFIQPPMFWSRNLWERTGGLDERYHYAMDTEWCNRALAAGAEVETTEETLALFALHPGSKTEDFHHRQLQERILMYLRLSRRSEFRTVQCLLSALQPAQGALTLLARKADRDRQRLKAILLRAGARSIGAMRLLIPGLRGAAKLAPEGDYEGADAAASPS